MTTIVKCRKNLSHTFAFILLAAITLSGCKKSNDNMYSSGGGSGTPGANEVWMQSMSFNPGTITVSMNTTITWTNKDGTAHTVTSDGGLFDSGTISSGGTYSHQFKETGTFPCHCTLHSSMTGKVVVQ